MQICSIKYIIRNDSRLPRNCASSMVYENLIGLKKQMFLFQIFYFISHTKRINWKYMLNKFYFHLWLIFLIKICRQTIEKQKYSELSVFSTSKKSLFCISSDNKNILLRVFQLENVFFFQFSKHVAHDIWIN